MVKDVTHDYVAGNALPGEGCLGAVGSDLVHVNEKNAGNHPASCMTDKAKFGGSTAPAALNGTIDGMKHKKPCDKASCKVEPPGVYCTFLGMPSELGIDIAADARAPCKYLEIPSETTFDMDDVMSKLVNASRDIPSKGKRPIIEGK